MARVRVIGMVSAGLVCTGFVTWSALAPRPSQPHSPAPSAVTGAAHVVSGAASPVRTSEPGVLARVLSIALPPRSESVPAVAAATTTATQDSSPIAPAKGRPHAKRESALATPAAGRETRSTIAALAKADRSKRQSPKQAAPGESMHDPDADWYAPAPEEEWDAPVVEEHAFATGRPRAPKREASLGGDWYDSLGERSYDASGSGSGADWFDATMADSTMPDAASSAVISPVTRASGRGPASTSQHGLTFEAAAPRTSASHGLRRVALAPAITSAQRPAEACDADIVSPVALPAPAFRLETGEAAVTVASLGPKLSGTGRAAFPGLAAPQPAPIEKSAPRFCPIGSAEKKTKKERWCTRADKGGVSFREGPVVRFHPNGKKRGEGAYVGGQLHGAFVEYSNAGRKIAEGSYRKGRKQGAWTFWWENGKKQSEGSFSAGDRAGVWTYYDEKGRKSSMGEIRTVDDVEKKEGRWVFWHSNGKKAQEGQFENGRKVGVWKSFDEKGRTLVASRHGEEIE